MQPFVLLPQTGSSAAETWLKLGIENHSAGKLPDAERCYRQAILLEPNHAAAACNLGILLVGAGQPVEGDLAVDRAALFAPNNPMIHANRALVKLQVEDIGEGLKAAERAVELTKDRPPVTDAVATAGYLLSRLAYAMLSATSGAPEKALPIYKEMLALDPKNGAAGPNSCFVTSLMDVGPAELRSVRDAWYQTHKAGIAVWPHGNSKEPMAGPCAKCGGLKLDSLDHEVIAACAACGGNGSTGRPLRVGYVGGDFKSHSAAMMFANVLLHHDPNRVVPYFYSSLPTDPIADDLTQKFQYAAGRLRDNPEDGPPLVVPEGHRWREIYGLTDEAVDDMIRKDKIDILVDLAGHTNGGRLGVFTRKPAPVQVTAWGFAHGTGVPEIDYFFADPVAVPENERQHFAERIYDLPSIVTYRAPEEYGLKPSSPLPFYSNEYITFGSFSRFEKLSDSCLATFAEILRRVPDSRLFLKDHSYRRPYSIRRVLSSLPDIDLARIVFGTSTPHPEHLGMYQRADLYLDTWPHGAGVVTLECLYQGVPLLTRYGPQPSGRTAASVLTALGRTDMIAYSADEFVEKAVALAGDPAKLAAMRKSRMELVRSPVIAGYVGAVERAYAEMWKEWCSR